MMYFNPVTTTRSSLYRPILANTVTKAANKALNGDEAKKLGINISEVLRRALEEEIKRRKIELLKRKT